jgi:hypothetical protein
MCAVSPKWIEMLSGTIVRRSVRTVSRCDGAGGGKGGFAGAVDLGGFATVGFGVCGFAPGGIVTGGVATTEFAAADSTRHGSEDSVRAGDNDRRDRTAGDQGHRVARADGGTGDRSLTDDGVRPTPAFAIFKLPTVSPAFAEVARASAIVRPTRLGMRNAAARATVTPIEVPGGTDVCCGRDWPITLPTGRRESAESTRPSTR